MTLAAAVARLAATLRLPDDATQADVVDALLTLEAEAADVAQAEARVKAARLNADGAVDGARAAIQAFFDETGYPEIVGVTHVLEIISTPRAVVVTDRDAIPEPFRRQKPWEPDKAAIKRALAAKEAVPGASLSNGGTSFRTILRKA